MRRFRIYLLGNHFTVVTDSNALRYASFNQKCNLKRHLRTVLALYNQETVTELHTDASMHGVGGFLFQHQQEETLRPICYYSRQTSKAEQHYHSYELQTLAVVKSMRRFRIHLLGNHFTVVTDSNALR
jgi:hypothetical protein